MLAVHRTDEEFDARAYAFAGATQDLEHEEFIRVLPDTVVRDLLAFARQLS